MSLVAVISKIGEKAQLLRPEKKKKNVKPGIELCFIESKLELTCSNFP